MADLAKLVVTLEAESARYQKELESARKQLGKFQQDTDSILSDLGKSLAAGLSIHALVAFSEQLLETADRFGKVSQAAGVSVEWFSKVAYAADLADVNSEDFAAALAKLTKNIGEAARGSKKQGEAFDALGISVIDSTGKIRSTEEVFLDLADRFSQMEDGATKNVLANDTLGKSYAALFPLLNSGRGEIGKLTDEAERFGVVISSDMSEAANTFNDTLTKLQYVAKGVGYSFLQEVLPQMQAVADAMLDQQASSEVLRGALWLLKTTMEAIVVLGSEFVFTFAQIGRGIGGAAAQIKIFFTEGYQAAKEVNSQLAKDLEKAALEHQAFLDKVLAKQGNVSEQMSQDAFRASERGAFGRRATFNPVLPQSGEGRTKKTRDIVGDTIKDLEKQAATLGQNSQQADIYKLKMAGATATQLAYAQSLIDTIAAFDLHKRAMEAGKALTESLMTPEENLIIETEKYQTMLDEGVIRQDAYNRAIEKAQKNYEDATGATQAAAQAQSELNSILGQTPTGKAEEMARQQSLLTDALDAGKISLDQYIEGLNVIFDLEKFKGETDAMTEFAKSAAQNIESAFAQFLYDPFKGGLEGMANGFADTLRKMVAEAAASQILKAVGQGLSGSDTSWIAAIGAAFAGSAGSGKAVGGNMSAGRWTMVGEHGPELAYSGTPTRILNNRDSMDALQGGGGVVQNFNITTPDANSFRASDRQVMRRARQGLTNA